MVDDFFVSKLIWDSEFFSKKIAHLNFVTNAENGQKLSDFELIQAKVPTENYHQINILNNLGFKLVEGEVDFSLWIKDKSSTDLSKYPCLVELASIADVEEIKTIIENNFNLSRYRQPWFSINERDSFYQLWAEKAIKGTFDDVCLKLKVGATIRGFITLKVENSIARIGLISVATHFQQQGVGKLLLNMSVQYCQTHNIGQLFVATQLANKAAISLYSKFGFSINTLSYWFYKTHDSL